MDNPISNLNKLYLLDIPQKSTHTAAICIGVVCTYIQSRHQVPATGEILGESLVWTETHNFALWQHIFWIFNRRKLTAWRDSRAHMTSRKLGSDLLVTLQSE